MTPNVKLGPTANNEITRDESPAGTPVSDDLDRPSAIRTNADPPRPPSRTQEMWTVTALVAVVTVLVVLSLVISGVFVPSSGPSGGGAPQPFSVAVTAADNVSGSVPGGPWSLRGVQGSDDTVRSGIQFGSNCEYSEGTGSYSIGPYAGNYSNGKIENWIFYYVNAKDTQALLVADDGGHASMVGIASPVSCLVGPTIPPITPGTIIDSTRIATTLLANLLVERFLASDLIANASFRLVPLGGPLGWVWEVGYQNCQIGDFGPANTVEATVNATTGTVYEVSSTSGVSSCAEPPSSTPIGYEFELFWPTLGTCAAEDSYPLNGCQGGDYMYQVTVVYDQSAARLGDLRFEVQSANGTVVHLPRGTGGFAVLNGTLRAVAESPLSPTLSMTGWTFPSGSSASNTTQLSNGQIIELDMGPGSPSGQGYVLVVNGTVGLSGTFSETLP